MKTKIFIAFFIVAIAFAFAGGVYQTLTSKTAYKVMKANNYTKDWEKVDSLSGQGLNKSALELVAKIYDKAKAENNAPQFVKAVIYRMKLESLFEEYSLEKSIYKLEAETKSATFPLKPVLQSMLAESYWHYYEAHRWQIAERSNTISFKNDDISTWDINKLVEKVIHYYNISIVDVEKLKNVPIDIYDAVVYSESNKEYRKLRPTLFDFLGHRAVDFYMSHEPEVSRPADKFSFNDEIYFADSEKFSKQKIETTDTLSLKFYGIKAMQQLVAFHLNDKDPNALVDIEIKRFKFLKAQSGLSNRENLFLAAMENMEKRYLEKPVSTELTYEIAQHYYQLGSKYSPEKGEDNKWDIKKAYEICQQAIDRFPDSFGANNCIYLQSLIKSKSLKIVCEEVNIPNTPFRALFTYKNLPKVYVRIAKIEDENYKSQYHYPNTQALLTHYLSLKVVAEFNTSLPNDGDYQEHNVEVKMPKLDKGNYVILTSADAKFTLADSNAIAYQQIWASSISYFNRKKQNGDYEFYVVDRETGLPLKNVTAQLWFEKYDYKTQSYQYLKADKFTSDAEGYFEIKAVAESRSYDIEFTHNDDRFHTRSSVYLYKYDVQQYTETRSFIFTDRAIYRPGQTIYFKGIMIEKDGEKNKLLTKYPTTVTFYDVNHQQIAEQKLVTNEYGTFNGTFAIPHGLLNGSMYINNDGGAAYFSVEDYKRPKFEVTMDPVKGSYKLNQEITVTGKANAYSGANIDGAKVSYRVVREVRYPYWFYWYRRSYNYSGSSTEITNGNTLTNDTGGFSINFKALPEPGVPKENEPTYYYAVHIDVTDINGETHSAQSGVRISYKAIELHLGIPEQINKDNVVDMSISSVNMNSSPEPVAGNITVHRLKQPQKVTRKRLWPQADKFLMKQDEYEKAFPTDEYADETNIYKWAKEEKVYNEAFDTKKSTKLDIKNISKWKPGTYIAEAICKDAYGEEVKAVKYFTVFAEKEKTLPVATPAYFITLKGNGEPGSKARFLIGTGYKNVRVLYEIEHKNNIVTKEWITLTNEQKLIEIPIEEKHRGNFAVHFTYVVNNRPYKHAATVYVPHSNKDLKITFETFRNKLLPGQEEEWKLKITGPKGEKVAAEMIAAMYDASLDAFRSNYWGFSIYDSYYPSLSWSNHTGFQTATSSIYGYRWNQLPYMKYKEYDQLNWFGYSYYYGDRYYSKHRRGDYEDGMMMMEGEAPGAAPARAEKSSAKKELASVADISNQQESKAGETVTREQKKEPEASVSLRKNFNETAFFYPTLQTNEKGEVYVKFTMPEALTKWRMMGFAHTKDLMFGQISNELVTQKELMVVPNAPRFFRENDTIFFTSKITNLSDADQAGTVHLELFDAISMKPIQDVVLENYKGAVRSLPAEQTVLRTPAQQNFTVKKGASTMAVWEIKIPEGIGAITYRITAKTPNHSDGEEMAIPVLSNRMLITESMPLPIRGKQTKTFSFDKLISQSNNSKTLRNHKLTLEFTSNPAWYAVQALPYLMEYPYECAEQTFSRFYANSIASHIANSSPKIKAVFDSWKNTDPKALLSNLEKNQELKALMLEETPWVLQSQDETERKKRVALLFDLNKMSNELRTALLKLQQMQVASGAWPWFKDMPEDRYITQHIVAGMGHLDRLGVKNVKKDDAVWNMLLRAIAYMDQKIFEDYTSLKTKGYLDQNNYYYTIIHYLYARSFFADVEIPQHIKEAHTYYVQQAKKYWMKQGRYLEGMTALSLHRYNEKVTANNIVKALKENSLSNDEMGMYWKENYEGYYWYQAPVEAHAMMIEVFDEVTNDQVSVDALKVWLLKSKQTQDWKTTKATAEACYALLLRGTQWLDTDVTVDITLGETKIDPKKMPDTKVEAGTGYFKTSWSGNDIKPSMGKVTLSKSNEGVSWGALYWQYFEQLDKITPAETPLKLKKQLFKEVKTSSGIVIKPIDDKTTLQPGDKIKVRIELRVDRDMEYVHMKDMRASAFEPLNVFSGYRWQDGLGYYESTRDAATNFFFSYLPKGTYVFEYPLVVTHQGNFSNGVTSIQCMYAPEFTSHSEGIRVGVKK